MQETKALDHVCSFNQCPAQATHTEEGNTRSWHIVIYYCAEHSRAIEHGSRVGPVGIDACRVEVQPIGASTIDLPSGAHAIGPQ